MSVPRPDIDAIEARANSATNGWKLQCLDWTDREGTVQLNYFKCVDGASVHCPAYRVRGLDTLGDYECGAMELPNAEFVLHARTDVPSLIAYVRHLEDEIHAYEETLAVMASGVLDDSFPPEPK